MTNVLVLILILEWNKKDVLQIVITKNQVHLQIQSPNSVYFAQQKLIIVINVLEMQMQASHVINANNYFF